MEFRRVLFRSPGSGDAFGQFFMFDFESLREAAIAARGGDEAAYLPPPNFSTDRRTPEKSRSAFVQWSDPFGMDMPLHVAVGVRYEETEVDRKSTRLHSSHHFASRLPSSACK